MATPTNPLNPSEIQWVQDQLRAGNKDAIAAAALQRGMTGTDLSFYTPYQPGEINAYLQNYQQRQAPTPQTVTPTNNSSFADFIRQNANNQDLIYQKAGSLGLLQPQTLGTFASLINQATGQHLTAQDIAQFGQGYNARHATPTASGTGVNQNGQVDQPGPVTSFEDWLAANPAMEKKTTEDGRTYYQQKGTPNTTLDDTFASQLRQSYNQLLTPSAGGQSPYGTNLSGVIPGFTNEQGINTPYSPVNINGQQMVRLGRGAQDLMQDRTVGPMLQQLGFNPSMVQYDPKYGYVMNPNDFANTVSKAYTNTQTDSSGFDGLKYAGLLASVAGGFGGLNSLFPGLMEGGYQGLFSSLGQNASGQGGGLGDLLRQFGIDPSNFSSGTDSPWGVNPQGGEVSQEDWARKFAGDGAINPDGSINWDAINETMLNGDPSQPGQGLGTFDLGATTPVGGIPYQQLVSQYGPDVASKLLLSSLSLPAGSTFDQIQSHMDSMGSPDATNPNTGTNVGSVPSVNGSNPFNGNSLTGNPALDRLLGGLIPAGLGALGANAQSNAMERMQDKYLALGAPYRARLDQSYMPGFSMNNEPGYKDALDMSSRSVLSKLSANGGNPFDQPNSMTSALDYVTKGTALPALQNYRGQLGQFGQLGVAPAATAGLGAAQAQSGVFDSLGFGINQALNPQTDLSSLLKNMTINMNTRL